VFFPVLFAKVFRCHLLVEVNGNTDNDLRENGRSIILRKINSICEKITYNTCDKIVCVSRSLRESILRKYRDVANSKVVVIHNGSEDYPEIHNTGKIDLRQNLGLDLKGFYLVYIGALAPRENIKEIILNFSELIKVCDGIKLLIIGNGPEKPALLQLVKESAMNQWIIFLDYLPHKEMMKYAVASDIGVFNKSSKADYQGFHLKIVDYLSAGIPVIGPESRDLYFIKENNLGILYPYGSNEKFIQSLCNIYEDRKVGIEMGKRGREYFLKHMTWVIKIREVEKDIRSIYEH
jgi:glycosyltransferase involved in cell wall biosynthesis